MMIRRLSIAAVLSVLLAACGPDRRDAGPETAARPDAADERVTENPTDAHAAHDADANDHIGHGAAAPAADPAHADHPAPAIDALASADHADHSGAAPAAAGAAHAGHLPETHAADADAAHAPHAAAAVPGRALHDDHAAQEPGAGTQRADSHAGHDRPTAAEAHAQHIPATGERPPADPHDEPAQPSTPHGDHTAPGRPPAAGATSLATLIGALLEDSVVRQRIAHHPELGRIWVDPAVRDRAVMVPEMMAGMAKLLELIRSLVEDPGVQTRIEADAALRDLWSEPGVRQRVQPPGQP